MTDAVSTIALGIDTGTGHTDLVALRKEFTELRKEIASLNGLRADASNLVSGSKSAQNELATLSAELKASAARVNELEQQVAKLGKSQADSAKATTQAVKNAAKEQFDIQVTTANNVAREIAQIAENTTAKVREENAKRYSMGQSAKVGGVSYSFRDTSNEGDFTKALKESERVRREILANSQAMLIAETERSEARRREVLANSQAMLIAETDRSEALRREKTATAQAMLIAEVERSESLRREKIAASQTILMAEIDRAEALRIEKAAVAQTMLIAEIERGEARRREVLANSQAMQMAEIDRAEAMRREKVAVTQAMQIAEIDRAEAIKREKNATAQAMMIAEIDREEARKIEVARNARIMQMAEIDRAESQKREKARTANEMMMAEIDRAEALKAEVARNARIMQMAEIDRAEATKREKNATSQAMLIAEIERAEQRRAEIERNAREMRMAEIDRAESLRREKQKTANEMMIADTKRAEEERQLITNSRYQSQTPTGRVGILRNAASLYGDGTDQRRVNLATSRYGADAIADIPKLNSLEAALNGTRANGRQVLQQATAAQRAHTESMRDAHSAARGLAGGLGQLWVTYGSVIPLVAGAAVTGSMVKVFQAGKDVEFQLQFLRALADDLEKRPIDLDGFLKITDGTMASVKEAAGGMRALAQAGLDQKQSLTALPNILDLAAIGEMSVGQAALTATGVVHAFGLELNDIGHVGDVFAKVAASSNTSVAAMTESMKSASTVGEMFHVSMEEAAASIGVLAQRNITGTSAGTALTTALKNLYEPTSKAAAALKAMNITTDDGHGGLKNYTELLAELREKLAGLNDSSKAVFLGTITDQRGAKALSAITENIKEYRKFLDDARDSTGFMSKATLELEDTVQGSFQRMSNSMEGSFIKAFKESSPTIRQVLNDMNGFAKSESVVNLLSRLAVTAANLTKTLVEHSGAIMTVVGLYAGFRVLSAALNGYVALRGAIALTTLTQQASTAAATSNAVALTLEQQAALAAGRGMIFAGTAARFLTASFGPISLIIMAAVTAYELFHSKIEASDNAMKSANNTADTVLDYYQRQIEKLRELNKELGDFSKNGSQAANDTAKAVLQAQFLTKSLEVKRLKESSEGAQPLSYADKALVGDRAKTKLQKAEEELREFGDKLVELDNKAKELASTQGLNKKLNDKKGVENRLEQLIRDAGGDESDPAGNAATKLMLPKILALKDTFKSSTEAYKEVALKIVEYRKELNEKLGTFVAPKKGAESDEYRAAQAELDGKLQAIKDAEKSKLSDVKSNLDTHEIGDLQAIAQNLAIVKQAREEELSILRQKAALAKGEDKKAATQQIENKEASNRRADTEAERDADRQRREIAAKWAQDSLKSEAETFRKRGELIKAFQSEFDAKHGGEIEGLEKDIKSGTLTPSLLMSAVSRKSYLKDQRETGTKVASFDELQDQYDRMMSDMQEQLTQVAEKASQNPGFINTLGAAQAGDDIRSKMVPALNDVLRKMREIADSVNDNGMKASVSKMSTTLIKEADRSRAAWVATGKAIANSLSDSFGKGGKAAGGIINALIKQRETQKDIDDDLKKRQAKTDDPIKKIDMENKAREESAKLQISSYGDIAGAAKGFFDEHSKGYAAMQAAEKVFRAFEMAMALQSFIKKNFFTEVSTTNAVVGNSIKAQSAATSASAEIAAQSAVNQVKGVGAVVNQAAGGDALSAWPRMAAMAAAVAALGIMVSGRGSSGPKVDLAKERQKYTGTGYSYNESDPSKNPYEWELQKSESLTKAMEYLKDNSDIALSFSSSQLSQLEHINSGISGLANAVVQTTGLRGTRADELALDIGSHGSWGGFSSSSKDLTDSGILFSKLSVPNPQGQDSGDFFDNLISRMRAASSQQVSQTIGSVLSNGVLAQKFADIHTESSSWWGMSKDSDNYTQYGALDSGMTEQMGAIIKSMYSTIKDASKFLGKDPTSIENILKGTSLSEAGLDRISLKGMTQEEAEKTLNAAFSKLGDIMVKKAMPGIAEFKKASEDYLTTLVRVSSGVDEANYSLQKLGVTAVDYTQVLNKQGDVAAEIVRDSLMAKEMTWTVAQNVPSVISKMFGTITQSAVTYEGHLTGIGEILKNFSGTASDMADTYTKLMKVRSTMRVTGMKDADVTSSMVRGAGGLDNLSTGMNDFLDNFFTDAEKAAAKVTLLQDEFVKIGKPMPRTKDEFKLLAQSIDRTTEAGQTLYGALIALAGQFSEVADSSGAVNPALAKQKAVVSGLIETGKRWLDIMSNARGLVDELNDALDQTGKSDRSARIAELQTLLYSGVGSFEQQLEVAGQLKDLVLEKYQTEKENAEKLIDFGKEMHKYVSDLKTGDLSPLTNKGKLEEALASYQTTLANTGSSDSTVSEEARSQIQDKANTLLELARTYYASSQSYTDIFGQVTGQLDQLGLDSTNKGESLQSLSESQLDELKSLRELATNIEASAASEYQSTVNQLDTQIGLMTSMDGSLASLTQMFADMPAELAMALGNQGTSLPNYVSSNGTAKDQIETMYSSILHRQSDQGGLQFWLSHYQAGDLTMDQIREQLLNSPEAKAGLINGSHAAGLDYVPFDGYVAELHRGERVLTATEARRTDKASMGSTASFSADERAEMAAEMAEMRKAMERMIEAQQEAAKALVRAMGATSDDNAQKIVKGTKDAVNSSDFDKRNKPVFN